MTLEIVPLGGVGEFGKNVLWLRAGDSSILLDVGVSFPDETFPGIDRIAPDLSVLRGERTIWTALQFLLKSSVDSKALKLHLPRRRLIPKGGPGGGGISPSRRIRW